MKSIVIDRSYFFKNTRYKWRTGAGTEIYVDDLKEDHLKNIYKLLCDKSRYFPKTYLGLSRESWKDILYLEISKRMGYVSKEKYKPITTEFKANIDKVLEDMDRRAKLDRSRRNPRWDEENDLSPW